MQGRGVHPQAAAAVQSPLEACVELGQVGGSLQDGEEDRRLLSMLGAPGQDPAARLDQGSKSCQLLLVEASQATREGGLEVGQARQGRFGPALEQGVGRSHALQGLPRCVVAARLQLPECAPSEGGGRLLGEELEHGLELEHAGRERLTLIPGSRLHGRRVTEAGLRSRAATERCGGQRTDRLRRAAPRATDRAPGTANALHGAGHGARDGRQR